MICSTLSQRKHNGCAFVVNSVDYSMRNALEKVGYNCAYCNSVITGLHILRRFTATSTHTSSLRLINPQNQTCLTARPPSYRSRLRGSSITFCDDKSIEVNKPAVPDMSDRTFFEITQLSVSDNSAGDLTWGSSTTASLQKETKLALLTSKCQQTHFSTQPSMVSKLEEYSSLLRRAFVTTYRTASGIKLETIIVLSFVQQKRYNTYSRIT